MEKNWKHQDRLVTEDILNHFPDYIVEFIQNITQEGFILTLVGGAVRDYFLTGNFSKDLDFELRHPFEYIGPEWQARLNHLQERLQNTYNYEVELLSFSIMRVSWPGHEYEVELAPARIESFDRVKALGHSDVEVELVSNRDYKDTFARRDFSLNAMGIEFYKERSDFLISFIDPYDGKTDLYNKELVPCGRNIARDPVRFCRALRFAVKFDLTFSTGLVSSLSDFNLSKLTSYYFFKEGFKVDFFKFCTLFYQWSDKANIPLSNDFKSLKFLGRISQYNLGLKSAEEVLIYLIYQDSLTLTHMEIENFCKVSKIKMSLIDRHLNLKATLDELGERGIDEVKSELTNLDFDGFLKFDLKSALKRFHTMVSKRSSSDHFHLLGRVNSRYYRIFINYSALLPDALEGKDQFQSMLPDTVAAQRSDALYYCHLKSALKVN